MLTTTGSHKLYTRRWFVLILVTVLALSNTEVWCSYASVPNIAAKYYKVSVNEISLLSMIYFICCLPFGLFSLWFTDYIGLNKGIWVGAWLNAIGATIKFISTMEFVADGARFKITLFGQVIAGMAQMYLYVPTKVAELWFSPNERALATSLMAMASPFGIMLGIGLMPLLVTKPVDIPWMNFISCVFAVISAVSSCGFTSSKPPEPPSESAEISIYCSFYNALKEMATNKAYLLILLFGGSIVGISGTFLSLLEGILYPDGYSNKFSGLCVVLMVSFGIAGSALCGVIVDKTKLFTPIAKITGGLTCIVFPVYLGILAFPNMEYVIAFVSVMFGITCLMTYTVLLELAVECTFPQVPEATSTGVLFIVGQLHGTIYFLIIEMFASEIRVGDVMALNMKRSLLIVAGMVAFFCAIFIFCFKTEYKRTNEEYFSNLENVYIINSLLSDVKSIESTTYGAIS